MTQGTFVWLLSQFEKATGIYVVPELRHKVSATRYRIPDVAVFAAEPDSEVPDHPPMVAIEVLSPDDRIGYVVPKLDEYRRWGVTRLARATCCRSCAPQSRHQGTRGRSRRKPCGDILHTQQRFSAHLFHGCRCPE